MFFFFYILSLPDKLPISPKIVCCDMILNLGGGVVVPPFQQVWPPSAPRLEPPLRTRPCFFFFYVLSFYVFSSVDQLIGIHYHWHISNIKYAFGPVHTHTHTQRERERESVLILLGMKIVLWDGKKPNLWDSNLNN